MLKPIYIYLTRIYLFDLHDIHNPHILWPGFTSTSADGLGSFAIGVMSTITAGTRPSCRAAVDMDCCVIK